VRKILEGFNYGLENADILNEYNMFFFGDMNYRIELEWANAVELAKEGKWKELREFDQLKNEMEANRVFCGFKEDKLSFPMTYKYKHFKKTMWEPVRVSPQAIYSPF